MPSLAEIIHEGRRSETHHPWPRAIVTANTWKLASHELAAGKLILLGLWGDGDSVSMALLEEGPFAIGVVAIAGLPPLGIFMSEFLIVSSTFARAPLLAVPLVIGLLVGLGALFLRLNSIAFGEPRGESAPAKASFVPMFAHLGLVLAAGIYLPPQLVIWFQSVAKILG